MSAAAPYSAAVRAAARQATVGQTAPRAAPADAMFNDDETGASTVAGVAGQQLRAFIERVERLEEDKQAIADDIKEVFGEMKAVGFDTKAVRTIIRLRKKDQAERDEEEAILDLYKNALGMR
jgi:uncharacterized protein (UPF0335 family)